MALFPIMELAVTFVTSWDFLIRSGMIYRRARASAGTMPNKRLRWSALSGWPKQLQASIFSSQIFVLLSRALIA